MQNRATFGSMELSDPKKNLLNQYFELYTLSTEKRFRDKVDTYNFDEHVELLKARRKETDESFSIRFKLNISNIRTYVCELYFRVDQFSSLNLEKRNCTCPHALSGHLCEHLTVSLSYVFDRIKYDDDIASLFYNAPLQINMKEEVEIDTLLHSISKRDIINFIYSLEDDESVFETLEKRLKAFVLQK